MDYTISLSNNTEVGKGKVTITGINGYTGIMTKTFNIQPYDITKNALTYQNPQGDTKAAFAYAFVTEDIDRTDAEYTPTDFR